MPGTPRDGRASDVTAVEVRQPRRAAAQAAGPQHLSAAQWRLVLGRAGRLVVAERLPLLSAGIAFFAVLSVAPVLVTALSVYGAVNTPEQALRQLSDMAGALPPELEVVVADQLTSIAAASTQVLTRRGLTALLVALWTATVATSALIDALTLAYHEQETRSFARRTALAFGFVLVGALVLGALIAALGVVSRALVDAPGPVRAAAQVLVWLGLGTSMAAALALLYGFAPDRNRARWHWTTWGATGATVLWLVATLGLFQYVQRLGTYAATYGSLAGVAISMLWLWLTVLLVLVGAAVNGEAERQTACDSTVGPDRPLGEREAVVADSAPPYPGEQGA
jgi:membrane protein